MSTDILRSILNTELLSIGNKFADLEIALEQRHELEALIGFSAKELFSSQSKVERNKKKVSKGQFNKLVCLYFSKFSKIDGFDVEALDQELRLNRNALERNLSKEWVYFLGVLVKLYKQTEEKKITRPRGLLIVGT